jgi:NAD(P)-dependent dehydrogenase (short-subunit alcohol dehydrogenase family)
VNALAGRTTIVVGASRGLGRGIATAFAEAGAPVVGVSRTAAHLGTIKDELADAGDPQVAADLVDRYDPEIVVLVAGAVPQMRPLQEQTWEAFSGNWQADVRISFHWLREILRKPLRPGSRVIVVSSGAALAGSSLSGGYAGAKATQRFLAAYAQDESRRAGLGIDVTAVLPKMTPFGDVGLAGVRGYAARDGRTEEAFLADLGELLTPEFAGSAVVDLVRADSSTLVPSYLLTAAGLQPLP